MAITGALADIEVVELLQFPCAGRRSGELVIDQGDEQAKLYYAKGRLVHATLGDIKGPTVLAKVVGWRAGDFVFHGEVACPERTIEMEVHHAVLDALRLRDEEAERERRRRTGLAAVPAPAPAPEPIPAPADAALGGALEDFLHGTGWALAVAVVGPDGAVLAEAHRAVGADLASDAVAALVAAWPRGGLRRCFVEDEGGAVVAVPLERGGVLLVAAPRSVATGMVSVATGKLAASLGA